MLLRSQGGAFDPIWLQHVHFWMLASSSCCCCGLGVPEPQRSLYVRGVKEKTKQKKTTPARIKDMAIYTARYKVQSAII